MKYEILSKDFTNGLLERFLRYTRQWTTSDPDRADQGIIPSTDRQWDFAKNMMQELQELGITDVSVHNRFFTESFCRL